MEQTWEEINLNMLKLMDGQIDKVRNKKTGQLIELLEDGTVKVYQGDGSCKEFENIRKALKFHWWKFHNKGN